VKYRNGEKIRQISREAQISRNTIRGIVRNKEQIKEGYERKVQPYPALGEYIGKLEKILRENKNTKPKPTNRHVYEEIVYNGTHKLDNKINKMRYNFKTKQRRLYV